MEGIFSVAECVLSRYSNDDDVFSRITRILLKEILDLRETLEFYELQFQQKKSAESPTCQCNSQVCPSVQRRFDCSCHLKAERPGGRVQTGEERGASVALSQTEEKFRQRK